MKTRALGIIVSIICLTALCLCSPKHDAESGVSKMSARIDQLTKNSTTVRVSRHKIDGETAAIIVSASTIREVFDARKLASVSVTTKLINRGSIRFDFSEESIWMEEYEGGLYRIADVYFQFREMPDSAFAQFLDSPNKN